MTIRAIRIHAYGGPEVLQIDELSAPVPSSGEAVVRVAAASVNFIDIQKRRGELVGQAFYKRWESSTLPAPMGSQGVGIVEQIGPDVSNAKPGDRVSFWGSSYATYVLVPASRLIHIPDDISFEQAAGGLNQGFLAYVFTHFAYPVQPGDWCLIQAAAAALDFCFAKWQKSGKAA